LKKGYLIVTFHPDLRIFSTRLAIKKVTGWNISAARGMDIPGGETLFMKTAQPGLGKVGKEGYFWPL
jgi:hypothetical protein